MHKVSVIIPNYNHAPYLQQRIESILNQTYQDFELIILDDCSTDHSMEIIEQYRGYPQVSHIVYNAKNSGSTFRQWDKGIELAIGEYIWIAESDDWMEESFLASMMLQYSLYPAAVIAFCQSQNVDINGNILIRRKSSDEIIVKDGKHFIHTEMMYENAIYNAGMCLFRKSVYKEVDRDVFINMKYCGDWFLWSLLSEKGDVIELKNPLNYFRKHNLNVSTGAVKDGLSILEGFSVFLYNRKYITDTKQYLISLYRWVSKWKSYHYNKGITVRTFRFFLKVCPLMVCIYFLYPFIKIWKPLFVKRKFVA